MAFARRFVRALSYFTITPVPGSDSSPEPGDVALLPLVGAVAGGTSGAVAYGASRVLSPRVGAAVAFALPLVLTGALHFDGFLDTCDAAFASVDVERRREILKDPRHGSFALAGASILALAQYAALREIEPADWPAALALVESFGRFVALVAARAIVERPESGTAARAFAERDDVRARRREQRALFAQGTALLGCAHAYGGPRLAASALAIALANVAVARWLAVRFGGSLSGDAYGFTICCASTAMLSATA